MNKKPKKLTYKVDIGPKDFSDLVSRFDLGISGVTSETLICTISTHSRVTKALREKHVLALKASLEGEFFVGEVRIVPHKK